MRIEVLSRFEELYNKWLAALVEDEVLAYDLETDLNMLWGYMSDAEREAIDCRLDVMLNERMMEALYE